MVAILLSTYNGEKYLSEQIDSILNQSYSNWVLYIHDDGSVDKTSNIIESYCKISQNIHFVQDPTHRGPSGSFLWLLNQVAADYYMFCDQDDVWMPNKIEISIEKISEIEKENGAEIPIIIHTDMIVVDDRLNTLDTSFWHLLKIDPKYNSFKELAVCNNVNGCTIIMNNTAKKISIDGYEHALMHDTWVALRVSYCQGIISYIRKPTVLYRQHLSNVVGAQKIEGLFEKILNIRKIIKKNRQVFEMLNHAGHISFFSYIAYKIKMNVIRRFLI